MHIAHAEFIVIFYHQRLFEAISVSCAGLSASWPPPQSPCLQLNLLSSDTIANKYREIFLQVSF